MTQEEILLYISNLLKPIVKPEILSKSYYTNIVLYEVEADYSNNKYQLSLVREITFENVRIIGYFIKENQLFTTFKGNTVPTTQFTIAIEMYNPNRQNINAGKNIYYVMSFYVYNDMLLGSRIIPKNANVPYYSSVNELLTLFPDFANYMLVKYEQLVIGIE